MKIIEPQVFLISEPKIYSAGLLEYLNAIGVPDWSTNATTDAEKLIEVMGRLCYRSFEPGLNPNVTKIREGNKAYIGNILLQQHGSVFEHAQISFIFYNVSRVLTHELVRHRVGVGVSQESLRFVRLDNINFWMPSVIKNNPEASQLYVDIVTKLEEVQILLAKLFNLDTPGLQFHVKKLVTSAMRRLAPEGLATTIGWSANFRTLRWVIENRTAPGAEEEIRLVFAKVAEICIERYPNVFSDFTAEMVDGINWYKPSYRKI